MASTGATASTKSSHLVIPAIIGVAVGLLAVAVVFLVRDSEPVILLTDTDGEDVQVWIEGDVARPGLYQLQETSTVSDVLRLAGAQPAAVDLGGLDPNQPVTNGLQIVVASRESPPGEATSDQRIPSSSTGQVININAADASTLELLPGIGPVLAGRIIEYRQQNGAFTTVDELDAIRGISPRMVDEMRSMISVGD